MRVSCARYGRSAPVLASIERVNIRRMCSLTAAHGGRRGENALQPVPDILKTSGHRRNRGFGWTVRKDDSSESKCILQVVLKPKLSIQGAVG